MQQLQFMQHRNAQLQRRDPNHPSLGGSVSALNSEGMMGQPSASVLAMKIPGLGMQVQKPNMQMHNQFLLASQQPQQVLAQGQPPNNLRNSTSYGDMDPRNFCQLTRGNMNGNRKRKNSSSGAANSTGTGNTVGPSPNSPPSTHTPGDGITTPTSMQHVNNMHKTLMMNGSEGTGSLASASNLLEDIDRFADVGSIDENMESLLSHDGGDGRELYGTLKHSPEHQKQPTKGFTFCEVGCIRSRNSKVTCCHFSSDGKLLASSGHDRKAVLWNMDTLQTESTPEDHKSVVTDVRFRPNSSQLATASVDKSVRLWDAANPNFCLQAYTGHSSPIMSLDFHPKKTDLFCFCDNDNEIQYWSINPFLCTHITKGGTAQVRFQPRIGQLLAAASDKVVSIFDIETDRQTHSLQGHAELVNYICWDTNGDYLASVSQNLVKVWSMASGECIQELSSNGNQFHSCVFHPSYSTLLVVGGISSLELWNMAENKSMTIAAHENIISALAQSPVTGMVASASHDSSVKLWK
ncbi:transcriptional corepressor LEUNIG-like [Citrus sinensis]|uniref:Transcriptional corepressor LEUNIG-like n=1 Tax=Citrus sinensis TaxID=2711 RepID=A0ACB8MG74_CITSI|nr:transcriptional corepressor LEUNIG-like [Citrus sinensis]